MIRSIYTAVSGMISQEAKQDVITNNLANAQTVGFKSDNIAIKKFDEVLIHNHDKIDGGKNVENIIGSLSMGSELDGTSTTFEQGSFKASEKQTDFAIDGQGFFTVSRQNALGGTQNFYTRNGNFRIDNKGILVTNNGEAVMGRNIKTNKVEPINVGKAQISCDSSNNISLDGKATYKFDLVDFTSYKQLQKVGDNLFSGANPINAVNAAIKQNSLEQSNVNVVNEVVNMMTVMRSYESNQKMIGSIDETLGKVINEVGSVR
jgi:flagellar basal-body rod protein FlgF